MSNLIVTRDPSQRTQQNATAASCVARCRKAIRTGQASGRQLQRRRRRTLRPEPDGPSRATRLLGWTSSDTPLAATNSPFLVRYSLRILRTCSRKHPTYRTEVRERSTPKSHVEMALSVLHLPRPGLANWLHTQFGLLSPVGKGQVVVFRIDMSHAGDARVAGNVVVPTETPMPFFPLALMGLLLAALSL